MKPQALFAALGLAIANLSAATVSGELKRWHKS
jgi:hypothetical protein